MIRSERTGRRLRLLLCAALLALAMVPWAPGVRGIDLEIGALVFPAVLAYVTPAILMAGWGAGRPGSVVGGFRFLAVLIAYEMPLVMAITAVAAPAGSLRPVEIMSVNAPVPQALVQPLALMLFAPAALAVCFLPPFDLPTAPGELAGGVAAEYTGWRLAVFRLARALLVVTLAAAITVFFLGGWLGPVLPPWAWSAIKTLVVAAAMLLVGRYVPRLREEHLLAWCWKYGIPLALFNIFYVGVLLVV